MSQISEEHQPTCDSLLQDRSRLQGSQDHQPTTPLGLSTAGNQSIGARTRCPGQCLGAPTGSVMAQARSVGASELLHR